MVRACKNLNLSLSALDCLIDFSVQDFKKRGCFHWILIFFTQTTLKWPSKASHIVFKMVSNIGQSFHEYKSLDGIVIYGLVQIERTSNICGHRQMEMFNSFTCYHQLLHLGDFG